MEVVRIFAGEAKLIKEEPYLSYNQLAVEQFGSDVSPDFNLNTCHSRCSINFWSLDFISVFYPGLFFGGHSQQRWFVRLDGGGSGDVPPYWVRPASGIISKKERLPLLYSCQYNVYTLYMPNSLPTSGWRKRMRLFGTGFVLQITFVEDGDLPLDTWVTDMVPLVMPENNEDDVPLPPMQEWVLDDQCWCR